MGAHLQRGDKIYLVTATEIQQVRLWADAGEGNLWVASPEDFDDLTEEDDSQSWYCSRYSWRRTRLEALELLKQRLEQRRVQLTREVEEITDKIGEVINELYPE